nr:FliI/YscN family ATPase [Thermanaeromonas toyohensis]
MVLPVYGKVTEVSAHAMRAVGPAGALGGICRVCPPLRTEEGLIAEVTALSEKEAVLVPLERAAGAMPGWWVVPVHDGGVPVGDGLVGRVIDGLGRPVDGGPPLSRSERRMVDGSPVPPLARPPIRDIFVTGVRVIDAVLTCGRGQRVGIFAGSGVGKSTLLGMIVRNSAADRCVVTLVGERGREIRDFVEKVLGSEGMARSVVIAAAADVPAPLRIRCAKASAAIAEFWRDCGFHVLWIIDSVTRLAHALREVGLAAGEPPAARGYPPTAFSFLSSLVERASPSEKGSITLFCTVLVEGDDMAEPVSDVMRSVLDGHIVLSRDLAARGHYPAVDVLQSVSRLMPEIVDPEHLAAARKARELLANYAAVQDLVLVGAYAAGSNPQHDEALRLAGPLMDFLRQDVSEKADFAGSRSGLMEVVGL